MSHTEINEFLIPKPDWVAPELSLYEGDDQIKLSLEGAIQYSGLKSIGGVVLGFRLLQHAVALTSGELPVQRNGISVYTAFPGNGVKDAFEYTCRAIRDHRYCCDNTLHHPAAQSGVRGQFLFVIRLNEQTVTLSPATHLPENSYFEADRNSNRDMQSALAWRDAKINFANTLLKSTPEECLRVL